MNHRWLGAFLIVTSMTACQSPVLNVAPLVDRLPNQISPKVENPNWKNEPPLRLRSQALSAIGGGAFKGNGNYLALPTPYGPVQELFVELSERVGLKLITRGEAHVTVLTPPEYGTIKSALSMKEIERIAEKMSIDETTLEPVCLGRGRVQQGSSELSTYFIVVKSPRLEKIRLAIDEAAKSPNGGFEPTRFFPHITVGFTKRDLHESDGVLKGENSCLFPIEVVQ